LVSPTTIFEPSAENETPLMLRDCGTPAVIATGALPRNVRV
jgi:hypothetical protein